MTYIYLSFDLKDMKKLDFQKITPNLSMIINQIYIK